MTYLIYDGTFEAYISAIFDVYEMKLEDVKLRKSSMGIVDLFAPIIELSFEQQKFERVKAKLIEYIGKEGFNSLWKSTLSESEEVEDLLLSLIRYIFTDKKNVLKNYGNPNTLALQQILKKLSRERHRMTAFVRFELGKDKIFMLQLNLTSMFCL